jgi:diguanylate cyclase (GGDEF)-like protein
LPCPRVSSVQAPDLGAVPAEVCGRNAATLEALPDALRRTPYVAIPTIETGRVRDDPSARTTFRLISRLASLLVAEVALAHAVLLYLVDEPAWIVSAFSTAICVAVYPLLSPTRRFATFLVGIVLLAAVPMIVGAYLALQFGREAGFHLLLVAVVPLIAVAGRIGPAAKWVLIAVTCVLVVVLDVQGTPVAPGRDWLDGMRVFNLGVVVFALGWLALHYFHIAAGQQLALEQLASTDALTGLVNRRRFEEVAAQAIDDGRRHGYPVAFVLCDLDRFKQVNDRYGHDAGDAVLRHVARLLRVDLRGADGVGRWGGEEFALVLPHTDLDGAAALAERIRRRVAVTPAAIDGGPLACSVTLGVALVEPPESLAQVFLRADAALYRGKAEGRDRVVVAGR